MKIKNTDLFILFLADLGLHCMHWLSLVLENRGFYVAVHWLLIVAASLVAELRL